MTLAAYKALHGFSLADLARQFEDRHVTTIHGWLTGRRMPSLLDALMIERATDGQVTPRDFAAAEV